MLRSDALGCSEVVYQKNISLELCKIADKRCVGSRRLYRSRDDSYYLM